MDNDITLALKLAGMGLLGVFSTLVVFYVACRVLGALFGKADKADKAD